MTLPYIAIGNNELGDKLKSTIDCPHCGKRHRVQKSKSRKLLPNGELGPFEVSNLLQFYKCTKNGNVYLCGIEGKAIK